MLRRQFAPLMARVSGIQSAVPNVQLESALGGSESPAYCISCRDGWPARLYVIQWDRGTFDRRDMAALDAAAQRCEQVRQGQVMLVRRPGELSRRHAADSLAAAHIHLVAASMIASGVQGLHLGYGSSP